MLSVCYIPQVQNETFCLFCDRKMFLFENIYLKTVSYSITAKNLTRLLKKVNLHKKQDMSQTAPFIVNIRTF